MARVLITTQVFPPEIHPTAVMARELAEGLASRGWEVTVAAGLPHHPTGQRADGYGRALRAVEKLNGFRLIRGWHPTSRNRSIFSRSLVMITQMLATTMAAASAGPTDVVLSFGGPPLLGPVLSGMLAWVWSAPLITVIHDLYPDVAIETGSIRNRPLLAVARMVERLQYRLSDSVVVLGEAMRSQLVSGKKFPPDRIHVMPVWIDPNEIRPLDRNTAWRREYGIKPEQFVVLYAGTAGIVSGAEVLAEVADRVGDDVVLVLVGGGHSWQLLQSMIAQGNTPKNLKILPYQPRERLAEVQASADLSLVTLLPGRGRTSVPSKVQGYMAAGRPVLAAVDATCDTALLISRKQFGIVVPPGDPDAIVRGILEAKAHPERLREWGQQAREALESEHAREPLIDRYDALLRKAIKPGGEP